MNNLKHILLSALLVQFLLIENSFSQVTEKCGTFSSEVLAKVGFECDRPEFYPQSSTVYTIQTTHFIVHFIIDEQPLNPDPPSDVTTWAYAQKVSQAAEASYNFQIGSLGWQAYPGDGDCGGAYNKYDIYIKAGNFYGETQPETQVPGTNGFISYIKIANQISTTHFIIHWQSPTTQTYAQNAANYAEYANEEQCGVNGMNWRVPPPDDNRGGDNRYDIYLVNEDYIPNNRGVTQQEIIGNWTEEWAPCDLSCNTNI